MWKLDIKSDNTEKENFAKIHKIEKKEQEQEYIWLELLNLYHTQTCRPIVVR